MASPDPVSAEAAINATDATNATNAIMLPPAPTKQKARMHWDLEEQDEDRLRVLDTLRAPNLAFATLIAHVLRPETRPVSVDDPELPRRTEDAWLALFREASSDAARQELRGILDKHLTGNPPPLEKSWTMRAELDDLQAWYEDVAWDRASRNGGLTARCDQDEAKREKVEQQHCAFLEQESFYPDKRRNADTWPFMEQYGKEVATNRDIQPDAAPVPYREHEDVVSAWRQFFQDPRPDVVNGANLSFEQAKLKLEDEARWERLKCMPLDKLDALLFALLDEHGPTQFQLEWYGEDLRDQAKRVVLELFVGAQDGHAVRKTFDEADAGGAVWKVIQGGVLFRGGHAQKLKAKLCAHRYTVTSDKFAAYLFCNRDGKWEAAALGLQTFPWVGHFNSYNITPVELYDPIPERPWGEKELKVFYSIVDDVRDQLAAGKIVVVACMMGQNRSKAVLHALNPTPDNEPTCDSMRRAAKGYREGKDTKIVPLKPEMAIGKRRR